MYRIDTVRRISTLQSSVGGIMCIGIGGVIAHFKSSSSSTRCLMEGSPRSRPPTFGATIPNINRGLTYITTRNNGDGDISNIDIDDSDNCPMCKKFSKGPCGDVFKRWLACTEKYEGQDALNGEPLHLDKCSTFAESLAKCLDENTEYYTKEDTTTTDKHDIELTDAWIKFVNAMESGIASNKYAVIPFPKEEVYPKIEISLATRAAAVFFNNQEKIIAAYILDDNGQVIAAGSKEDINIEGLGCVLQFKVNDGLRSVKCRVIYDIGNSEDEEVEIYSRTVSIQ